MDNKRGSHIGMMLSFMFFSMFVVFIYVFLSPKIFGGPQKENTLDYVKMKLIENLSSELTSTGIQITSVLPGDARCINFEKLLSLIEVGPSYGIIVKNELGDKQNSYIFSEILPDLQVNRTNPSQTFFRVYASPEFDKPLERDINPHTSKRYDVENQEYSLSVIRSGNYLFEQKVEDLIDLYTKDYPSLKDEFEIPARNEFSFSFEKTDGVKIEAKKDIFSENVYAEKIPVQYVDKSANIQAGFITIKIW